MAKLTDVETKSNSIFFPFRLLQPFVSFDEVKLRKQYCLAQFCCFKLSLFYHCENYEPDYLIIKYNLNRKCIHDRPLKF
jgi:hypothetical protein